jgi:thioredoxin reductase
VLIVGGSVAGLSAATYLGRMRRTVLLVDSGQPCNRFSHASHGFLTRDGSDPAEIMCLLGCDLNEAGSVKVDAQGRTNVPGIYAAGDMTNPMRAVIFAASQGAAAGIWLTMALMA